MSMNLEPSKAQLYVKEINITYAAKGQKDPDDAVLHQVASALKDNALLLNRDKAQIKVEMGTSASFLHLVVSRNDPVKLANAIGDISKAAHRIANGRHCSLQIDVSPRTLFREMSYENHNR